MINFLKKRLGYGLAGFMVGLFVLIVITKIFNIKNISDKYLLLMPLGLILGLAFPKQIGKVFMGFTIARVKSSSSESLDPEQVEKGPIVSLVYIFGILLLLFLVWIVLKAV